MDKRLKKYARLLIEVGLNVQKGQSVLIGAPVERADFARLCADCAYDSGAREVTLLWRDDYLSRQKYLRADAEVFSEVAEWQKHLYNDSAENRVSWLSISASDPEVFKGVDPERLQTAQRVMGEAIAPFRTLQASNGFAWCIGALPVPSWAKKVFPELPEDEAMDKLLDAILTAVRVSDDNDPVKDWNDHLDVLMQRRKILNGYRFKSLHYKNSIGTDLVVELPERHVWQGGGDRGVNGKMFIANMPTEETFTLPLKTGVNGTVCSAMPLVLNGNIVDNFKLTFKDGKCIAHTAEKGEEHLAAVLSLDEGASYLGEVALVQHDSPISNSGILFYNTLFDENASCHFALGQAYPCFEDFEEMSEEEIIAAGANKSVTHIDFMVGTKDLSITGITHDGKEVPVFVEGNFAF